MLSALSGFFLLESNLLNTKFIIGIILLAATITLWFLSEKIARKLVIRQKPRFVDEEDESIDDRFMSRAIVIKTIAVVIAICTFIFMQLA